MQPDWIHGAALLAQSSIDRRILSCIMLWSRGPGFPFWKVDRVLRMNNKRSSTSSPQIRAVFYGQVSWEQVPLAHPPATVTSPVWRPCETTLGRSPHHKIKPCPLDGFERLNATDDDCDLATISIGVHGLVECFQLLRTLLETVDAWGAWQMQKLPVQS